MSPHVVRQRAGAFLVLAATVAACQTASSPSVSAQPTPTQAVTTGSTTVPALATDQACTAHAPAGSTLRATAYRTDDLAAMTVPRSGYGSALGGFDTDWLRYGYLDNVELPKVETAAKGECNLNRSSGRIVGFSNGFVSATQNVATSAHLFFTPSGAAAWIKGYVAGLKSAVGTNQITSVRSAPLAGPGSNAVLVTVTCRTCVTTYVLFRQQQLVGWVVDVRPPGARAAVDVKAIARTLATRMSRRASAVSSRAADPVDAVMALSAGLPKGALGSRYTGLVWDWLFGGCWDPTEAASQTATPAEGRRYLADAKRYGMLTFCRAMYAAPAGTSAVKGVERVFTGGTLYTSAAGAQGALGAAVSAAQRQGGKTVDGTTYGPLVRWNPGAFGDRTVGYEQRVGSIVVIRAYVRYGRYLAVAALNAHRFTGMRGDVSRWTALLDKRVTALLRSRTF